MEQSTNSSIDSLLEYIKEEKQRLIKEKKIKKTKPLPKVEEDEFLFQIPKHWKWVRFEEITINRDGERVPVSQRDRENREKIYDYYGASGVIDKIDDYIFDQSLLLIGEDGANLLSRSKPIAFMAHGKYWVNNHAHAIDAVSIIILKYLEWYMNFIDLSPYVTGSAQPKLTQAKLNSIPVALPPLAEQVRIVNRIESLFDKVNKASELVDEARYGFEKRRAAILERAFSGELTKTWREENGVSDEWDKKRLSDICEVIMGQSPKGSSYNDLGEGIPLVNGPVEFGPRHFSKTIKSKWTTQPTKMCKELDLLLCVRGSTLGRINIAGFEACIGRGVAAIRAKEDVDQMYINYKIHSMRNEIYNTGTGTTFPNISSQQIKAIEVDLPSVEEQKKIVDILDKLLGSEADVDDITDINANIDIIKKSILAKAFRGELESNDLDEKGSIELLKNLID